MLRLLRPVLPNISDFFSPLIPLGTFSILLLRFHVICNISCSKYMFNIFVDDLNALTVCEIQRCTTILFNVYNYRGFASLSLSKKTAFHNTVSSARYK